jgi:hypothetical protein
MTTGKTIMRALTQNQLAAALPRVRLPGGLPLDACLVTTATPAEIATAIFEAAADLQPEPEWETGAVYADPGLPGNTYRRIAGGWLANHSGSYFKDGELVTSKFIKIGWVRP